MMQYQTQTMSSKQPKMKIPAQGGLNSSSKNANKMQSKRAGISAPKHSGSLVQIISSASNSLRDVAPT